LDKAQHFIFCAAVTLAAYYPSKHNPKARPWRLVIGAAAGIVAGILKEVGDVLQVRADRAKVA
jgi:hypothetical protein